MKQIRNKTVKALSLAALVCLCADYSQALTNRSSTSGANTSVVQATETRGAVQVPTVRFAFFTL